MTDSTSAIPTRYDYDPYGRRTKISGDLNADFAYTGHYHHAVTGFSLTLYRAYDPGAGSWITRDPMREAGGINLYSYVRNDPIRLVDPLGLSPDDVAHILQGYKSILNDMKDAGHYLGGPLSSLSLVLGGNGLECDTQAQYLIKKLANTKTKISNLLTDGTSAYQGDDLWALQWSTLAGDIHAYVTVVSSNPSDPTYSHSP